MQTKETLSAADLQVLAFDGHDLVSEIHCAGGTGEVRAMHIDFVTSRREETATDAILCDHRDIYYQRGWRRLDGKVLCPACADFASPKGAAPAPRRAASRS